MIGWCLPAASSTFPDGSTYYGQSSSDGDIEGDGEYIDARSNRYVGEFRGGTFEGVGTYYHADGRADASRFVGGQEVGVGVAWNAERTEAWLLVASSDGSGMSRGKAILLSEAAEVAASLGLPVPPIG